MPETFRVTPSVALAGTFDPEQRFALFPPTHTIKGLFFPRLVDMLGDGWNEVAPTLRAPPRDGRYSRPTSAGRLLAHCVGRRASQVSESAPA